MRKDCFETGYLDKSFLYKLGVGIHIMEYNSDLHCSDSSLKMELLDLNKHFLINEENLLPNKKL